MRATPWNRAQTGGDILLTLRNFTRAKCYLVLCSFWQNEPTRRETHEISTDYCLFARSLVGWAKALALPCFTIKPFVRRATRCRAIYFGRVGTAHERLRHMETKCQ